MGSTEPGFSTLTFSGVPLVFDKACASEIMYLIQHPDRFIGRGVGARARTYSRRKLVMIREGQTHILVTRGFIPKFRARQYRYAQQAARRRRRLGLD